MTDFSQHITVGTFEGWSEFQVKHEVGGKRQGGQREKCLFFVER